MHATELSRDMETRYCEFAIDGAEYIDMLPTTQRVGSGDLIYSTTCCAGSIAWCIDGISYTLNGDDEWVEYSGWPCGTADSGGGGGGDSSITVQSLNVTENGVYRAQSGRAYNPVRVNVPDNVTVEPLSVTLNGRYTAPAGIAYSPVNVNVSSDKIIDPIDPGDVTFYDYDGLVIAAYTTDEFASLTTLPSNPERVGLTAQGWNWILSRAKEYVNEHGSLNIGQNYIPDDGKTHLFIRIPEGTPVNRMKFYVRYRQTDDYGVTVDWGDGSPTESFAGTYSANHEHTYANTGEYEITLSVTSGTMSLTGTDSYAIYGRISGAQGYANRSRIIRAYIGGNVTSIDTYAFQYCNAMTSIVIPDGVTVIDNSAFQSCCSLTSIVIPSSVTSIGNAFYNCYSMTSISIPDTAITIGSNAFQSCNSLPSISIPDGATSIGSGAFQSCYALSRIVIPGTVETVGSNAFADCQSLISVALEDGLTGIGSGAFMKCYSMTTLTIHDSTTSIGSNAFQGCGAMAEYHFEATEPPTLVNANAFADMPSDCVIYVPYSADHSILNAYKTATNWSVYAGYMQEDV